MTVQLHFLEFTLSPSHTLFLQPIWHKDASYIISHLLLPNNFNLVQEYFYTSTRYLTLHQGLSVQLPYLFVTTIPMKQVSFPMRKLGSKRSYHLPRDMEILNNKIDVKQTTQLKSNKPECLSNTPGYHHCQKPPTPAFSHQKS